MKGLRFMKTLSNLEKLVGKEFDENDIITSFESEEEVIVNKINGQESNFEGHGNCTCYNAYIDKKDSYIYTIYVDKDNDIVCVK